MKGLKYTVAYLIPLLAIIGVMLGGMYNWLTPVFAFVLTPIVDALFKPDLEPTLDVTSGNVPKIYDWMLYINVPLVYGCLVLFAMNWMKGGADVFVLVGQLFSLGVVLGSNGINVAHELGHRHVRFEMVLAQLLLLPSFYMHFTVEHNRGHHLRVATPEDPATARKNEVVYLFWLRSVVFSYLSAWNIQMEMTRGRFFTLKNKMGLFTLIQLSYVLLLYLICGFQVLTYLLIAGGIGILLLETINYIEHYGLLRMKNDKGRYEPVELHHSWNANYPFGRLLLYDLTRHSDHHYDALKKYPNLENQEVAPCLPFGYPAAMVISMVPPLWFFIMNKRLIT